MRVVIMFIQFRAIIINKTVAQNFAIITALQNNTFKNNF